MRSVDDREPMAALVREFSTSVLRPRSAAWDAAGGFDEGLRRELSELGFFGMLVPEDYGGLALEHAAYAGILAELGAGDAAAALEISVHGAYAAVLISRYGSEAQKEQWLPALATGQVQACFALSEPGSGWDLTALETRADRDGPCWVLNGRKSWVTAGGHAGLAVVVARVEDGAAGGTGASHVGIFLVPASSPGYRVAGRATTMGLRATSFATLDLRGVRLGPDALVGDPGGSEVILRDATRTARLGIAAISAGIARAALEHAVEYAGTRQQFGREIRQFEAIQAKLADMAARVEASRALVRAAAQPGAPALQTLLAKVVASEAAEWVAVQAIQTYGGYGYMRDYPVEKLLRDAKAMSLCEGANELLRIEAARELYGQEA